MAVDLDSAIGVQPIHGKDDSLPMLDSRDGRQNQPVGPRFVRHPFAFELVEA